jgi:transcriptional regulator with XRE-family HTH domain
MPQHVIGPALKLARTVQNLTQQQAGERIGLGPDAAKNVFALYERGARVPNDQRMPNIIEFIEFATQLVNHARKPAAQNGLPADAPPMIVDDVDLAIADLELLSSRRVEKFSAKISATLDRTS